MGFCCQFYNKGFMSTIAFLNLSSSTKRVKAQRSPFPEDLLCKVHSSAHVLIPGAHVHQSPLNSYFCRSHVDPCSNNQVISLRKLIPTFLLLAGKHSRSSLSQSFLSWQSYSNIYVVSSENTISQQLFVLSNGPFCRSRI